MVALGAVVNETTSAEPADYGLLSPAVTVIEDNSPYWVNGFDYETLNCLTQVDLELICNSNVTVSAVEPTGDALWRKYFPFGVRTTFKCSTMGRTTDEIKAIAEAHLEACTQKAVEYELWTGALATEAAKPENWDALKDDEYPNRFLASESVVDLTPTPGTGVRAKHAQALLEGGLGRSGCGIKGTLHMPREVASVVGIKDKNGAAVTPLGNKIVAGSGYTGSGPGNVDPGAGKFWMYATGPVTVRLGEIYMTPEKSSQAVDIARNETLYYAERPAAVTWGSCRHYGVLVDLSLDFS